MQITAFNPLILSNNAEEVIETLEAQMGDPATYQDEKRAAQVARDHQVAQERLEALYEEWSETASVLEAAE